MKKNLLIIIVSVAFVIFMICLYSFWWLPQYKIRQLAISGYNNPHGCAVIFDYYWCEAKQRCLRNKDEDCNIEAGVKLALALKYKKSEDKIIIEIKKQSARFAEGRVWIEKKDGKGNRWLATKPSGKWEIVYDGLAPINCKKIIKEYLLPPSVLQGFCD